MRPKVKAKKRLNGVAQAQDLPGTSQNRSPARAASNSPVRSPSARRQPPVEAPAERASPEEAPAVDESNSARTRSAQRNVSFVAERPKRRKPKKTRWLNEIREMQRSTKLQLRRAPFSRVVREICTRITPNEKRFQALALLALQEAAEAYLTHLFEDSNMLCTHAGRVTLMQKDMKLCLRIWSRFVVC